MNCNVEYQKARQRRRVGLVKTPWNGCHYKNLQMRVWK